jgi:hypothetical protein
MQEDSSGLKNVSEPILKLDILVFDRSGYIFLAESTRLYRKPLPSKITGDLTPLVANLIANTENGNSYMHEN